MATKRLDRKTRTALTVAVIVLLAGPLLLLRGCVSNLTADGPIVASNHRDDRVIFIGGHTMLLEHGSVGRQIGDWLNLESTDTRAFEIGDQTFAPNSLELTPVGWIRLAHFAQLMKGNAALTAHILVSARTANPAARRLGELRAMRLRDALIAQGVPQSRVLTLDHQATVVSPADTHTEGQPGGSSQLLVLLCRSSNSSKCSAGARGG